MLKPKAIIVDLDGTLANLNGRSPYKQGQAQCEEDVLNTFVRNLVIDYKERGLTIIIVSGRFRQFEDHTIRWLEKHNVPWDELFLRGDDDTRSDDVIKQEIYDDFIKPFHAVYVVIDDRPKVIRMWKRLGLPVIDVGTGEEF